MPQQHPQMYIYHIPYCQSECQSWPRPHLAHTIAAAASPSMQCISEGLHNAARFFVYVTGGWGRQVSRVESSRLIPAGPFTTLTTLAAHSLA